MSLVFLSVLKCTCIFAMFQYIPNEVSTKPTAKDEGIVKGVNTLILFLLL